MRRHGQLGAGAWGGGVGSSALYRHTARKTARPPTNPTPRTACAPAMALLLVVHGVVALQVHATAAWARDRAPCSRRPSSAAAPAGRWSCATPGAPRRAGRRTEEHRTLAGTSSGAGARGARRQGPTSTADRGHVVRRLGPRRPGQGARARRGGGGAGRRRRLRRHPLLLLRDTRGSSVLYAHVAGSEGGAALHRQLRLDRRLAHGVGGVHRAHGALRSGQKPRALSDGFRGGSEPPAIAEER